MASLAFAANAVTYMIVKCADGSVDKYDVDHVTELYYTDTHQIVDGVSVTGKEGLYTYVDLGLPSGTMWATYNVGATKPSEYGDYFAWGETKPKKDYDWSTYKWCEECDYSTSGYCITKYDKKKTELDAEDDAATANWGSAWRMPTDDEIKELVDGCKWLPVYNFNNCHVNGMMGISKSNGFTIFLPAAGRRGNADLSNAGSYGYYWSSSLYGSSASSNARYLYLDYRVDTNEINFYRSNVNRRHGQSVRAVLR